MPRAAHRLLVLGLVLPPFVAGAGEPVDLDMVTRIRDEGLHRSEVMETVRQLTDVIGPRLTGSPQMKRANEWTRDKLAEWGLENAGLHAYAFGRGWSFTRASVQMIAPEEVPLIALPKAWAPGIKKAVRGQVMRVDIEDEDDFEEYRGKLAGKILFMSEPREIEPPESPIFKRFSEEQLTELTVFEIPGERREDFRKRFMKRWKFSKQLNEFLVEEKALATFDISSRDSGIVRVGRGGSYEVGESTGVPALVMATEQYNRIVRLLEDDGEVELEIQVKARFHDEDTQAYNTVAEIPGTDKRDELVMVGAHLDSWHAGTGATDNAAGCAAIMEAVRILTALEIKPRRTIRIALWSGEEQGRQGSRAYVAEHFASRPEPEDPEQQKLPPSLREQKGPLSFHPEFDSLSVYFNLDNGSGKIRGIYGEENAGVRPIFEAWLEPFHDLGADTVTLRRTRGTDHQSFGRVGLPGFQFIQDGLDYRSRTHHSNMDVYDHLQRDDLIQASVVMASFLYHAAMREEMLPRKPLPKDEEEEEEEEKKEEPPDEE